MFDHHVQVLAMLVRQLSVHIISLLTESECDIDELTTPNGENSYLSNFLPDSEIYTVVAVIYRSCNDPGYGFINDPSQSRLSIKCTTTKHWTEDNVKHCIRESINFIIILSSPIYHSVNPVSISQ